MLLAWGVCAHADRAIGQDLWIKPPAGYSFQAPTGCPDIGARSAIYRVCEDQLALLNAAFTEAHGKGKLVLAVFGATWCPLCKGLHQQFQEPGGLGTGPDGVDLDNAYVVVDLATSAMANNRRVAVPSGEAALQAVLATAPGAKLRAVPFVTVLDPKNPQRTFARNLDDLQQGKDAGFDADGIRKVLAEAYAQVRLGQKAPDEPNWLWRKLKRWWNR